MSGFIKLSVRQDIVLTTNGTDVNEPGGSDYVMNNYIDERLKGGDVNRSEGEILDPLDPQNSDDPIDLLMQASPELRACLNPKFPYLSTNAIQ